MDHAVALPANQLDVFLSTALLTRQAMVLRQLAVLERPAA
jgi:hypothetical protein